MKYRNKIRALRFVTRLSSWLKSNIITCVKRDVPSHIAFDIEKRLSNGEREIILPMCKGELGNKGIVDYLNEYHNKTHYWGLEFLHIAFKLTEERIRKLSKYSDITIETLDISDTDKRIIIKMMGVNNNG